MKPSFTTTVIRGAVKWAEAENFEPPSFRSAEVARLRRLGFIAGVGEALITPGNQNRYGLTLLEQFSSPRSAMAEVAHAAASNGPNTYFAVPGIPGARGFEASVSGSGSARDVAFADGPVFYRVGAGWNGSASNAVTRAKVIAGALRLYRRVHGASAG